MPQGASFTRLWASTTQTLVTWVKVNTTDLKYCCNAVSKCFIELSVESFQEFSRYLHFTSRSSRHLHVLPAVANMVAHLHGLKIKGHCKRHAKLIIPGISGGWRCRLLWLYVAAALVAVLFNGEISMASPQRWKIVSSIRNQ